MPGPRGGGNIGGGRGGSVLPRIPTFAGTARGDVAKTVSAGVRKQMTTVTGAVASKAYALATAGGGRGIGGVGPGVTGNAAWAAQWGAAALAGAPGAMIGALGTGGGMYQLNPEARYGSPLYANAYSGLREAYTPSNPLASLPITIGTKYGIPNEMANWPRSAGSGREQGVTQADIYAAALYGMGPPNEPMGGRRAPERKAIEEKRRKQALYAQQYAPTTGGGGGYDFGYGGGWSGGGGYGGGGGGSNPLHGALMMWRIGYE